MLTKKEQRLRRSRQTRIRIATQGVARLTVNRTNLHIYASVISGDGSKVLGDPVTCMVWLANFLRQKGSGLRAGEIITTGTCTGANDVPANTTVVADFGALGKVQVRFVV